MGEEADTTQRRGARAWIAGILSVLLVRRARAVIRAGFQTRVRSIEPTKGDYARALAPQMTERPGQDEWPTPPHDPEHIRWGKVTLVTIIALSFYTIGTIIAWFQLMILQSGKHNPIPDEIGTSRINMLIQPLFDLETASYEQHRLERLRLSSYGWSDRRNQMIHIPVERAMEDLVEEHEKQMKEQGGPP